jgi:hypothetical protein
LFSGDGTMAHDLECLISCSCAETRPGTRFDLRDFLLTNRASLELSQHPLGFLDVVPRGLDLKASRDSTRRLAVHIWHESWQVAEEPRSVCHSHGWSMTSAVHAGALVNRRFDVRASAHGPAALYQVVYSASHAADLLCEGPVSVACESEGCIEPGIEYSLGAGEFHDSVSRAGLTVTSMVAGRPGKAPFVVYDAQTGPPPRVPRQRLEARSVRAVLDEVLAALTSEAGRGGEDVRWR